MELQDQVFESTPESSPFSRPPSRVSTSSKPASGFPPTSAPAAVLSPNSRSKKAEIVVSPKYDFDLQILKFNTNETEQVCKSNIQEVQNLEMYHNTEDDLADKENDNKDLSLKAFIRKKEASKVEVNLEEETTDDSKIGK